MTTTKNSGCIAAWMVMFTDYQNSGTNERNWTKWNWEKEYGCFSKGNSKPKFLFPGFKIY